MASENSSEDEFETLYGPVRPLFEPTAKPGTEWIKLPQRHAKLVLGSFDNVNSKNLFFIAHRRYSNKLTISNYLFIDILHVAYSFGDSIFSLELAMKSKQKYENKSG